jgi:hypothetical protein
MRNWDVWLLASIGLALGCGGERSAVSTPERGGISDSGGSAGVSDAAGDTVRADASDEDTAPGPDGSSQDSSATDTAAADTNPTDTAGCVAGTRYCEGSDVVECQADGTELLLESCAAGCLGAACADPCAADEKSYFGCGFVAVDLDNSDVASFGSSAAEQQFAVTVSNPGEVVAEVSVAAGDGRRIVGPLEVAPGALQVIRLPRADADNTSLTQNAYLVTSTAPVVAHQFNPEQNAGVYSNDASLLLPISTLGNDYLALAWPTEVQNIPFVGPRPLLSFVAIASAGAGTSQVTITAPAGTGIAGGPGFEALAAGASRTVALAVGQVLSLTTEQRDRADLTGLRVRSDRPVALFTGSECANVPLRNTYCDHLEEQNLPLSAWGRTYAAAKFRPRGSEPDLYRVVAAADGTTVTTRPPQAGALSITLRSGQVLEFLSTESFLIEANSAISVAQFMVGSSYPGPENGCTRDPESALPQTCTIPGEFDCIQSSGVGDPAQLMLVADEQLRDDYLFLVPTGYEVRRSGETVSLNYASVVSDAATTLTLDGVAVTEPAQPIGTTGRVVRWLEVDAGAHRLRGSAPFALYVYGYDCDVSYAYAGGLDVPTGLP